MIKNIQLYKCMFVVLFALLLFACDDANVDEGLALTKKAALKKAEGMSDEELAKYVFAGAVNEKGYQDGVGVDARFDSPHMFSRDSKGTLYVADTGNNVIRKISPEGEVTTFAGKKGAGGFQNGHRLNEALFNKPTSIVIDTADRMYISDSGNHRIRKIVGDVVSTLVGGDLGYEDNQHGKSGVKFQSPFKLQIKYFKDKDMFLTKAAHHKGHKHLGKAHLESYEGNNSHDIAHKKHGDHMDISLRDGPNGQRWREITLKDGIVKEVITIDKNMSLPILVGKNSYVMIAKGKKGAVFYILIPTKHVMVKFGS